MKIENPKVKIGKVLDEVRNIWANILTPDEKMKLEEKAEFILSQSGIQHELVRLYGLITKS